MAPRLTAVLANRPRGPDRVAGAMLLRSGCGTSSAQQSRRGPKRRVGGGGGAGGDGGQKRGASLAAPGGGRHPREGGEPGARGGGGPSAPGWPRGQQCTSAAEDFARSEHGPGSVHQAQGREGQEGQGGREQARGGAQPHGCRLRVQPRRGYIRAWGPPAAGESARAGRRDHFSGGPISTRVSGAHGPRWRDNAAPRAGFVRWKAGTIGVRGRPDPCGQCAPAEARGTARSPPPRPRRPWNDMRAIAPLSANNYRDTPRTSISFLAGAPRARGGSDVAPPPRP